LLNKKIQPQKLRLSFFSFEKKKVKSVFISKNKESRKKGKKL